MAEKQNMTTRPSDAELVAWILESCKQMRQADELLSENEGLDDEDDPGYEPHCIEGERLVKRLGLESPK